jgi:para-nitrobenzyl esterase
MAGQGVMLVSFNYRLGMFGFLGLEELDQEGRTPSGNLGLQDMLTALRWVKANIAAFRDPDHVTLFGQSAGSHSVGLLRPSPIAKEEELFHKGTMESRAWWDRAHGQLTSYNEAR